MWVRESTNITIFSRRCTSGPAPQGYTVDGIDYLLWAFAAAEINNSNPELAAVFEDLREEISSNLRKLLRDTPAATEADIEELLPTQAGTEK